ncbi:MAG: hypothetical protein M1836_002695 [Candelina mexicana]|nr:MAG: hypothetical protein M1836_002695 [Candelina mexicana]
MYKNGRNGVLGDMQAVKQEILGLETTRFRRGFKPISSNQQHLHLTSSSIDHSLSTVNTSKPSSWISIEKPREFAGEYQFGGNGSEIYGKGAWSTVYKATLVISTPPTSSAIIELPTPPPSPVNKVFITNFKPLAIKAAGRRDAKPVLEKEARILTYLTANTQKSSQHVADFLGYDTPNSALVLEAVPLTLSDYTAALAATTRQRTTTTSRSEPVIGTRQWLTFTSNLVAGLKFLKDKGVVHGDIKPQNILLRETTPTSSPSTSCDDDSAPTYTPLFADFSSSHVLTPTTLSTSIEEIGAVTAEYTAPELLLALRPSNPNRAVATFATDVFALGVTLIQVAIGESCYSGAANGMMKNLMMNEGRPMEFARGGEGFMRVRKGGLVDRVVGGAVAKKVEERFEVEDWVKVLEGEV